MNCKSTKEMLSAYLDRELATQERDAVRAHLADCDGCRREERDLRALKGLLLGVRVPEPAEDFEDRLMSRLRSQTSVALRPRWVLPQLRPLAWAQLSGLAAAAALATMVVIRSPQTSNYAPSPARPHEMVAQNEIDVFAQRDDAYSRGDDFTAGSSLLTTSYGP